MERESRPSIALWIMFIICIGLIVFIYFYLNNKISYNLLVKEYGNITKEAFNEYINVVEGDVEGGEVKVLCNRLVENAERFKDVEKLLPDIDCVNIELVNEDSVYEKETSEDIYAITLYDYNKYESDVGIIENNIITNDNYTVSYEYDENGYISKITITGHDDEKASSKKSLEKTANNENVVDDNTVNNETVENTIALNETQE